MGQLGDGKNCFGQTYEAAVLLESQYVDLLLGKKKKNTYPTYWRKLFHTLVKKTILFMSHILIEVASSRC